MYVFVWLSLLSVFLVFTLHTEVCGMWCWWGKTNSSKIWFWIKSILCWWWWRWWWYVDDDANDNDDDDDDDADEDDDDDEDDEPNCLQSGGEGNQ